MIKEKQKAPAFKLKNQKGVAITLKDLKGKNVILYFYPRDLTPGCTIEACDFNASLGTLNKKNTVVLGVSFDNEKKHQKFIKKNKLKFDLLVDESKELAKKYGVYQKKKFMGREYMGIVRSTFVIDPKGCVKKVFSPVRVAGHVGEVLRSLGP